jgi:hypothetical protein
MAASVVIGTRHWMTRNARGTSKGRRLPRRQRLDAVIPFQLLHSKSIEAIMHLPSLLVALGVCGAVAAPLEQQQPLPGSARHHAGPNKVFNPYKPGNNDPFDKKIDSQGDKLQPLPYVSSTLRCLFRRTTNIKPIENPHTNQLCSAMVTVRVC